MNLQFLSQTLESDEKFFFEVVCSTTPQLSKGLVEKIIQKFPLTEYVFASVVARER
jgi:hypothetical protein